MNSLYINARNTLHQLKTVIDQLTLEQYILPIPIFENASVGKHCRHIIELFHELEKGYETGFVQYDLRKRDLTIETDRGFALNCLDEICNTINKTDRTLVLSHQFQNNNSTSKIDTISSYRREIIYNIEHCTHHLAIIKIGILSIIPQFQFPNGFGYADATVIHANKKDALMN